MGCMPGRRHWHHYTPITPGEESPLCWVGQGDKNLSIHPALGRGAPGLCPPTIRMETAGAAPASHCRLLTILKVLRNEVRVFRSLPATQGRGHWEMATWKCRGMVLDASAGLLPENGCMEKAVSCPSGDRGVALQSSNPLPGLLSLASAVCQCQSWCLCWTATVGLHHWVGATKKHVCRCVSGPGPLQCES